MRVIEFEMEVREKSAGGLYREIMKERKKERKTDRENKAGLLAPVCCLSMGLIFSARLPQYHFTAPTDCVSCCTAIVCRNIRGVGG